MLMIFESSHVESLTGGCVASTQHVHHPILPMVVRRVVFVGGTGGEGFDGLWEEWGTHGRTY